jgi:integrase
VAKLVRVFTPPRAEREPLNVDEVRAFLKPTRDQHPHPMFVVLASLGLSPE